MAEVEHAWRNAAYELQVKQKSERRAAKSARRKERKAKGTEVGGESRRAALVASLSAPPLTRPSTALGIRPRAGSGALDSTCEITPPPP